jgi:predicted RNA polymerase sigma factor
MLEQNRALWDQLLIHLLARAEELSRALGRIGTYTLQAAIAACQARALPHVAPSPIVELNRAVAVGMAEGPAAGLAIIDAIANEPALKNYHLLPSVRADLLYKLGRHDEARAEFQRAASLTQNSRERDLLLSRASNCDTSSN